MKKIPLLLLLALTLSLAKAQFAPIPDTAFGSWLNANGYAACMTGNNSTGWRLDTTCSALLAATTLSYENDTFVRNLEGIGYFKNVYSLSLRSNSYLASLGSSLPAGLMDIDLTYSGILSFPPLPSTLLSLRIDGTPINQVPSLPASLTLLDCGRGAPKILPSVLPPNLIELECSNAFLIVLPAVLPTTLRYFDCSYNQLSSLPLLPDTIDIFDCSHNSLTHLTNMPVYTSSALLSDNPNLTCLPAFGYITQLDFTNTGIACTPSTNVGSSTPALSTIPLCSTSNPNGCNYVVQVWPGDANNDRHADNADLLNIGLGFGSTGTARSVASIVWIGQTATDWIDTFLTGVNYKFADCNGDGVIDANDTMAISQNYGLIHAKTDDYNWVWRSGAPALTVHYSKDTVLAGDTLITTLLLGDATIPVSNIYGLSFTYHYDALIVDTLTDYFQFENSWLGNGSNSINIHKDFRSIGEVKASITGINHTNRSGNGEIAKFWAIITTGNINGKDLRYYHNRAYVSDIKAVDQHGNTILINAGIDSNSVGYEPNGINENKTSTKVNLYPNPAKTIAIISTGININGIVICNMLGQEIRSVAASNKLSETIDISTLEAGIYTVHVSTQNGTGTTKLIIQR